MKKLSFGDEAKRILTDGYVLALPTETVYGLGVRWDDEVAYKRLYEAKLRKPTKPIAVMCGTNFNLDAHFDISDGAMRVIKKFLPGPLTVLVKAKSNVPFQAHLGTNVVGIRVPGKKELLDFLETLPFPLQVTSANISGKPPLTKCEDVIQSFELNENIKGIVEGDCESSIPTTVVDLTGEKPVVIRKGEISEDEINETFRKNLKMKISIGCDHGGYNAKEKVKQYLMDKGYEVIDCGTNSSESCNYPDYAFKAAEMVANHQVDKGVLICSSGEGVCMCANKVKGIRCGIGYNDDVAHLIVEHNHANMIAFGAKFMEVDDIIRRIDIFLNSIPQAGRHETRVDLIKKYEEK